jgi:NTE family protein
VALRPVWLLGSSSGAVNGALIAGNHPDRSIERLREFWAAAEPGAFAPTAPQAWSYLQNW